ncbi:hypothetical protein Dimus_001580, partial [Dionaea muscipula]
SGSKFGFVRFDCEKVAGRAVLNADDLMLMDKILHVKRAAYERNNFGLRPMAFPPSSRQELRIRDGLHNAWGGSHGEPTA